MRAVLLRSVVAFALALTALAAAAFSAPAPPDGQPPAGPGVSARPFDRPDAATIEQAVQAILSDPRFAPRTTLLQWLLSRLSDWELPRVNLSEGWVRVVLWAVTIWCVLALLAILGHIAWTLALLVRSRSVHGRTGAKRGRFRPGHVSSYEELCDQMDGLAAQGALREAVSVMMLALLRWLDGAGVVRLHQSKTNGDYAREYAAARPGSDLFRRLALAFDGIIYGGTPCRPAEYARMHSMYEQVQNLVSQGP
jgi:hypothetical protein